MSDIKMMQRVVDPISQDMKDKMRERAWKGLLSREDFERMTGEPLYRIFPQTLFRMVVAAKYGVMPAKRDS